MNKRLLVGLLGLTLGASAQAATWYVDNAAAGGNNGTSWANAWTSLGAIGWASVNAGDTIYISGGSSSQTYNETLNIQKSGASGSRITLQVGQDAGHNGKVIIDAQGSRTTCVGFGGHPYVTISGNNGNTSTNLVLRNAYSSSQFTGVAVDGGGSPTSAIIEYVEVDTANNGMNISGSGIVIRNSYIHGIRGDRAINTGGPDAYDSVQIYWNIIQLNSDSAGYGPDGIQGGNGITVHDNVIYTSVGTIVGQQHPDAVQAIGNHYKIYNNYVHDMGNSFLEGGSQGSSWAYYIVYNNVVTATVSSGGYKKGIEFSPNSAITSVHDMYFVNNTFVDLTHWVMHLIWNQNGYNCTPTISNFVMENNIMYNTAILDTSRTIQIEANSAAVASDYGINYNIINAGVTGGYRVYINGSAYTQPNPISGTPTFVSYSTLNAANNYHLKATDTAALDHGVNASAYVPAVDRDGVARPQGSAWDVGAYEYTSGGASTNLPPVVSAITQNIADADPNTAGLQVNTSTAVQYSGSATDPNNNPLTWQWIYTVNGGAEVVQASGSGAVTPVSYTYPSTSSGNTYVWKLRVNDGFTTAESTLTVSVLVPPPPPGTLTFEAESGTIASPFVVNGTYISQSSQTTVTTGGRAAYSFTLTNSGSFVVQFTLNAPSDAENSIFYNIDAEPQDPSMIWDIPVTTGFSQVLGGWRGAGTYDANQFQPKVFTLATGTHQLIIRGREPNVQIDRLSILQLPTSPANLRVLSHSP